MEFVKYCIFELKIIFSFNLVGTYFSISKSSLY